MPDPASDGGVAPVGSPAVERARGGRRVPRPTFRVILPLLVLPVFVGAWWAFSGSVHPVLFPSPQRVWDAYGEMLDSGELLEAARESLLTFVVGSAIAVVAGVLGALVVSMSRAVSSVVNAYVTAIYATPVIAMVPIIIIWLGVSDVGRIAIVVVGGVIPVYINAFAGFTAAREDLVEMARSFGAHRSAISRYVLLPGAVPFIVAGLRIGLGRALASVIVAEVFLDLSGLGGVIQTSVAFLRVDKMIASTLVVAVFGFVTIGLLSKLEARLAPWRDT